MYQVCVSSGYGMMPEDIANNKKSLLQHWTPRSAQKVTSGAEAVFVLVGMVFMLPFFAPKDTNCDM